MQLKLIQNGEVFAPEALGVVPVLIAADKLLHVGQLDVQHLRQSGVPCEVVDASGCYVLPGLIDPHQHLIGAGGETGFATRLPEVSFESIVRAGITTVVGLLGTDTITRSLANLYAKVRQLAEEGITALMFTGGFELPPRTLTGSVFEDLILIDAIIGTGEIAISDSRWIDPELPALAHVVGQTQLGGRMAGKAGVVHFHVGSRDKRLELLNTLLERYEVPAEQLYITHITRSHALLEDAAGFSHRGGFVDMDTVEMNIADSMSEYFTLGGDPARLTVSSDAHTPGGSPQKFFAALTACLQDERLPMTRVLPCFTRNTADVLQMKHKGRLQPEADADVLVLKRETFEVVHVLARGQFLIRDGQFVKESQQHTMSKGEP